MFQAYNTPLFAFCLFSGYISQLRQCVLRVLCVFQITSARLSAQALACKAMVDVTEESYGKLDILFNNAGIMHMGDDTAEVTEEDVWDLTMNINVKVRHLVYCMVYGV